jgi:hypothetical protein
LDGHLYRDEEAYFPSLGTNMLICPADEGACGGMTKAA